MVVVDPNGGTIAAKRGSQEGKVGQVADVEVTKFEADHVIEHPRTGMGAQPQRSVVGHQAVTTRRVTRGRKRAWRLGVVPEGRHWARENVGSRGALPITLRSHIGAIHTQRESVHREV